MNILIRGMEMPKNCWDCACSIYYESQDKAMCDITDETLDYILWKKERHLDCPLIELPPHGRLIDADEPMTKISTMMQEPDYQHEGENWMVGLIMARDAIDEAETVIEGSET